MLAVVAVVAVAGLVVFVLRLLVLLQEHPAAAHKSTSKKPLSICVVLGSGGHTSEMFAVIRNLPDGLWAKHTISYVVSVSDKDSEGVADSFEATTTKRPALCFKITRSREVGQSYVTSIVSTLRALLFSVVLMWRINPDVILTNGPGVCVPVVFANLLISAVTFSPRASLAYFESFTCVDHLSLSGRILFPLADVFTVQWRELEQLLKKKSKGRLWFTGPEAQGAPRVLSLSASKKPSAVVTVGSTCFDELMVQVDSEAFFAELHRRGIRSCVVQKGRTAYAFKVACAPVVCGVEVHVVDYKPFLREDIQTASLVISHAGAGTILEALSHGTPTVVVPNERLMSNHQMQLARSLSDHGYLFFTRVDDLLDLMKSDRMDVARLHEFPGPNKNITLEVFRRVIRRDA